MKIKSNLYHLFLALFAIFAVACEDIKPDEPIVEPPAEKSLSVAPLSLEFANTGGDKTIQVMASEGLEWSITITEGVDATPQQRVAMSQGIEALSERSAERNSAIYSELELKERGFYGNSLNFSPSMAPEATWVRVGEVSGSGNRTVVVTADENQAYEMRNATITLTAVDMKPLVISVAQLATEKPVDPIVIEDPKFLAALLVVHPGDIYDATYTGHIPQQIDANDDGIISKLEAADVLQIYAIDAGVTSIKGIEEFPNLMVFGALNNKITEADFSANPKLIGVNVAENEITSLNVTQCPDIETIRCWTNKLTELDITGNAKLAEIICWGNQIETMDFSTNPLMERIYVGENHLTSLNLTNCDKVTEMSFAVNYLESVDLSPCTALESWLFAQENRMPLLDISATTRLTEIYSGNQTDDMGAAITSKLRCSTVQKIELLPYMSDQRNNGVEFELTDAGAGNTDVKNFVLTEIPEDGSTIAEDIWVIESAAAPTASDFSALYSALQSAGRMVQVEFTDVVTFPNDALCPDINGVVYYLSSIKAPKATKVGDQSFRNCPGITTIDMPQLSEIGMGGFMRARLLEAAVFPNLITLGDEAFGYCDLLYEVDMPNLQTVGIKSFQYCTELMVVKLPNVTTTSENAFLYCESLQDITLPNIVNVGKRTFYQCYELVNVTLPKAVNYGSHVFYSCDALTNVTLSTESTDLMLDAGAFDGPTLSNVNLTTGADNGTTVNVDKKTWQIGAAIYGPFKSITTI